MTEVTFQCDYCRETITSIYPAHKPAWLHSCTISYDFGNPMLPEKKETKDICKFCIDKFVREMDKLIERGPWG